MVGSDRYRKMFGEVALEHGYVTAAQLYEALTIQARRKNEGKPDKLLGQLLLELGYMNATQVKRVIDILYPAQTED